MVRRWCSHCLQFCRAAANNPGFTSCSTCGKVLGQTLVQNVVKFKRKRKSKKIRHALTAPGVDSAGRVSNFLIKI